MSTVVVDSDAVTIPEGITTVDAFRAWLDAGDLPEKLKTWFLDGEVWVDMSREQLDSHLGVKEEITRVLGNIVKGARSGRIYPDGVFLTNRRAGLSGNPDMVFVSNDALASGRIKRVPGKDGGFVELDGTPDMILEVVSDSSEKKDNQTLREAYWEAGIPEYWLVDARGEEIELDIL
jgi:Uma2 family endonuclease